MFPKRSERPRMPSKIEKFVEDVQAQEQWARCGLDAKGVKITDRERQVSIRSYGLRTFQLMEERGLGAGGKDNADSNTRNDKATL